MQLMGIRTIESRLALELIDKIEADLTRLRALIRPEETEVDPKDPRNKSADGKFTARGVEVCYRLFDKGATRYAVAEAMGISFGAATHRWHAWRNVGGASRKKARLET